MTVSRGSKKLLWGNPRKLLLDVKWIRLDAMITVVHFKSLLVFSKGGTEQIGLSLV